MLEDKLKKSLTWIICSLYLYELPLRHLCKEYIGSANGPSNHKGIIGEEIQNCENIEIFEDFVIMHGTPLPEFELNDLSMDKTYSDRIIKVIQMGVIDYKLFKLKPRKISHSRWLTTANRLCRLYVTKNNSEIELKLLINFIVSVYGPSWFEIKQQWICTHGSKHYLNQIKRIEKLPEEIKKNSDWAHSEHILVAMLGDQCADVRNISVKKMNCRFANNKISCRKFKIPTVDENMTNLNSFLDHQEIFEPPITAKMDIG